MKFGLKLLMLSNATFAVFAVVEFACTPKDQSAEAKSAYSAQQMNCVAQYNTRAEIDACREGVRESWGFADAGADGSPAAPAANVVTTPPTTSLTLSQQLDCVWKFNTQAEIDACRAGLASGKDAGAPTAPAKDGG